MMKHAFIALLAIGFLSIAGTANAACVAEYKAKQDNPLRLDHGTVTVQGNDCTKSGVEAAVRDALASRGWILLSILSVRQSG